MVALFSIDTFEVKLIAEFDLSADSLDRSTVLVEELAFDSLTLMGLLVCIEDWAGWGGLVDPPSPTAFRTVGDAYDHYVNLATQAQRDSR